MNGQNIRGFVGQGMNGQRPSTPIKAYNVIGQGSTTVTIVDAGTYRIVGWGAGANGSSGATSGDGGGAGGYFEVERWIAPNTVLSVTIGKGGNGAAGADGSATSVPLPSGEILTANGGKTGSNGRAGGTASTSGGYNARDIFLTGGAGGTNGNPGSAGSGSNPGSGGLANSGTNRAGGGGAPGNGSHHGGNGNSASDGNSLLQFPGGGGAYIDGALHSGADGMVLIYRIA